MKPWEKYQTQPQSPQPDAESSTMRPWEKYQKPTANVSANSDNSEPEQIPDFDQPLPQWGGWESMLNGMSFGFADEVGAAGDMLGGVIADSITGKNPDQTLGQRWDESRSRVGAAKNEYEDANPVLSTSLDIGGGMLSGGIVLKGALGSARTGLQKIGAGALGGAGAGVLSGAGNSEGSLENRVQGAVQGGALGAVVGAALPVVGQGIGKGWQKVAQKRAEKTALQRAPTNEQLKDIASKSYEAAADAGAVYKKDAFESFTLNLMQELEEAGIDKTLHPKATAALERVIQSTQKDVSLADLETLRRIAQGARKDLSNPDESRISKIIIDGIDGFVENTADVTVSNGSTKAAAEALTQARKSWGALRKSELVDELVERAKNQASGYENGLRIQFRALANNKKKLSSFTPAEQQAIKRVARGGAVENMLRLVGRLSFSSGGSSTNIVGGSIGAGAGASIFGPAGAVAVPVIGGVAQKSSEALTRRNVGRVSSMVRLGGSGPQTPVLPSPMIPLLPGPVGAGNIAGQLENRPPPDLKALFNDPRSLDEIKKAGTLPPFKPGYGPDPAQISSLAKTKGPVPLSSQPFDDLPPVTKLREGRFKQETRAQIKQLRDRVFDYYKQNIAGSKVMVDGFGEVIFDGGRKMKSSSANPIKLALIPRLPEILKSATYIEKTAHDATKNLKKEAQIRSTRAWHRFSNEVTVEGEVYPVTIIVREDASGNFHYNIGVTE